MMTTTTMIQFILIVLLINSINSQSANSQRISLKKNNNENNSDDDDVRLQNQQPRKLSHVVENITHSNYINDDGTISEAAKSNSNIHDLDEEAKEYQYFNDASAVSTPKYDLSNYDLAKYESPKYESLQYAPANYEPTKYGPPLPPLPASIEIPNNYKIDESDLTHSYYSQLEPTSYDPSDTFIRNRPVHAIPSSLYDQQPISPGTSISEVSSIHSVPGRIVKVTHHPIWAPDVQRLESQYFETYRAIKSSVLSFYYKMQYILNYVMGLFAFAGELNTFISGTSEREKILSLGNFRRKEHLL